VKDLFRFLFLGEVGRVFHIRRVRVPRKKGVNDPPSPPPPKPKLEESTKSKLLMIVTCVLSAVLIGCVIGAIALPAMGKEVPSFIPSTITGIIGYFGGAICAFFGLQPPATR
jgi:hypothetical protein